MTVSPRLALLSLAVIGTLVGSAPASARSHRQTQIPNGADFGCTVCHTSSTGGARNAFGTDVQTSGLDGVGALGVQNVAWSATLAALDSDGDGLTNGEELGDPDGTWQIGDVNPDGDTSNPGDPEDPGAAGDGDGDGDTGDAGDGGCGARQVNSSRLPASAFALVLLALVLGRRRR